MEYLIVMITYYWVAGYHPDGLTIDSNLNFNLFAYEEIYESRMPPVILMN